VKDRPCVLVTAIGGNVGQGVLRIIAAGFPRVRVVGTNTAAVSGGNHLCDQVHLVPPAAEAAYAGEITRIVGVEAPDLIIPCTDQETLALSRLSMVLPKLAASPAEVCATFLDKYLTGEAFHRAGLPFARSALPSRYDGAFGSVIVKPREGRGSRDLFFNPADPRAFDDTYVVQELLQGEEVTIGFYVTLQRVLHGFLVMRRRLQGGTTVACEVFRDKDVVVSDLLEGLVKALPIRGSCNVQAIISSDGRVTPFEVNGRISGTASIRHHFGFKDVEYTLEEHLFGRPPRPVRLSHGSAHRLLVDVIYPDLGMDDPRDRNTPHEVF
jgi:carbamoyl-phosphate synthase large subunit